MFEESVRGVTAIAQIGTGEHCPELVKKLSVSSKPLPWAQGKVNIWGLRSEGCVLRTSS